MGAVQPLTPYEIRDAAAVASVRAAIRSAGETFGLAQPVTERAAIVASELAHNQLLHAGGGWLEVGPWGTDGIRVRATDHGPGIPDPQLAFSDRGSTAGSLGLGLGAARRLATELDFLDRIGEGCEFEARFRDGGRRGLEVYAIGRPHPRERRSGDRYRILRDDGDELLVGLADGLGHGPEAAEAAEAALGALAGDDTLEGVVARAHATASGTRGAALVVARILRSEVRAVGVGNVRLGVVGRDGVRRLVPANGTVGARGALPRLLPMVLPRLPTEPVLLWTDGLREPLAPMEPGPIAQRLPGIFTRLSRDTDDATVVAIS